jgi:cardiolipin synthase
VVETGRHRLALLPDVALLMDAFERDVARARRRVFVECYIVRDDKLGQWLARLLADAAGRGLDVRLIYDPLGSHKTEAAHFEDLRAKGVGATPYWANPKVPGLAPFPRDHGRVIVIDDAAYGGGAAWADEWLPKERGGEGWHDVCVRVEGPVVEDFAALFEQRWGEAMGDHGDCCDYDTAGRYPDLRLVGDTPRRSSLVHDAHVEAIRGARQRIWIANSYFYPPAPLLDDLTAAIARGIDVRVIVPGQSDLPIVERAARAEYKDWLQRGIALHEYGGCMMHS